MRNIATIHQHFLVNTYPFRGKSFVRGEDVYLYDENDNRYLDFMTNYGVNIFGYNHPEITKALQGQLKSLPVLHGSFANDIRAKAVKELVKVCGGKLKKVYFANSGTEAVEAAIKFAILATGRKKIIAAKNSYHGKTIGSLALTDNKKYRKGLEEVLIKTEFVKFGDIGELEKILDKETAAVVLEPIQGESGVILPPEGYLRKAQELCNEVGTLLILDEIQTGTGRTGKFLASHWENVEADIVCLGKGLAGGIPVGATLVSKEISERIPKLVQTSTFGGNPLACRGMLTVLELLNDELLQRIEERGEFFRKRLNSINSGKVKEVRGKGLMIGVEVEKEKRNDILKKLQKKHILAAPAGENVVRFLPPYIVTEEIIDSVTDDLKGILNF